MKTIYIPLNGRIYKVNQDTSVPTSICESDLGTRSSLAKDNKESVVEQDIFINAIDRRSVKTNRGMYLDMLDMIKRERITEVFSIENRYKIYVDYTIEVDGKETDHSTVIKPIEAVDQILPLGVAQNHELIYRRVKSFKNELEFKIHNSLPYGIMNNIAQKFVLRINTVAIFQDFTSFKEIHGSTYEVPYPYNSQNLNAALEKSVMIYSTDDAGIDFAPVCLNHSPKFVNVKFDIVIGNIIVAYDSSEVDYWIEKNLKDKYRPIPPHPAPGEKPCPCPCPKPDEKPEKPEKPGHHHDHHGKPQPEPDIELPDYEAYPEGDGDDRFDAEGMTGYYERCNQTNPGALLVVEDKIPPRKYNRLTMIHWYMVVRDIPDIQVGDYVIYREGIDVTNL